MSPRGRRGRAQGPFVSLSLCTPEMLCVIPSQNKFITVIMPMPLILLLRAFLLFLLLLASVRGESVHRLRLDFGEEGFLKDSEVAVSGDVVGQTLHARMGTLESEHEVLTLRGAGSAVELRLPNPGTETDVILELREAHDRRPQAFGYELRVNGSPVYFRTYQELGAGPNHYFVRIPSKVRGTKPEMTLGIHALGEGAFSLETLWMYENYFEQVGALEPHDERMGLVIPHVHLRHPGEIESYRQLRDYELTGSLGFAGYGHEPLAKHERTLSERLAFSAETDLPILLVANGTGWGGKPEGPDGAGGYFSDPQYSILDWHTDSESFRVSWPGMWGLLSTPTLRHPRMNDYLYARFERVYGGLRGRMAGAWRDGKPFTPWIIREFAPNSGEVSAENRRVTAERGLELDPRDGLSFDERLWMHKDAAAAWQGFADSTVRVIGLDPVVVDGGEVRPPVTQLRDDLYSHPDFLGDHPVNDPRWSGGQMGMVDGLWSSGEMGKGDLFRDLAMYDYLRARGRLAMINMERTILKDDFSMLRGHYAHGFDFVCMFNAYRGDAEVAARVDGVADLPAPPPPHREPVLLDLRFRRDRAPGPAEHIVALEGLHPHPCGLAVAEPGVPGSITYRLPPPEASMGAGLMLEVDGRISEGEGNRIEVFYGTDPASLRRVAVWTREDLPCPEVWTPFMTTVLRLPIAEAPGTEGPVYLRLEFHAEGGHDAAFLHRLSVNRSWDRPSGHAGDAEPFSHRELRILQRRVQARAMTGIWLERYRMRAGGEADAVYTAARAEWEAGRVVEAGRTVRAAISELLPARYWVRGHGPLGSRPIEVFLPDETDVVEVELLTADADGMEFRLDGLDRELEVEMAFSGEDGWVKERLGPSYYRVRRDPAGGSWRLRFRAGETALPDAPELPQELSARFLERGEGHIRVDVQNREWMGLDLYLDLPLAEEVRFQRRLHGNAASETVLEDAPEFLDWVRPRLNDAGEVVSVEAETGRATGRIARYQPPRLFEAAENGWIELEDGRRFALHYGQRDGIVFDTVALNGHIMRYELRHLELALRPGHEVELAYTPPMDDGALPRLFRVRQAHRTLLEVDFGQETPESWRAAAREAQGVAVGEHRPEPNYLYKLWFSVMRPEAGFDPGYVIYTIDAGHPLGTTAVEFTARAFEDSSRVNFFVSTDGGESWTPCGQFDNTWQNNISQELRDQPPQAIDLTPAVRGHETFLLKVELVTHPDDERFCLRTLAVRTEAERR